MDYILLINAVAGMHRAYLGLSAAWSQVICAGAARAESVANMFRVAQAVCRTRTLDLVGARLRQGWFAGVELTEEESEFNLARVPCATEYELRELLLGRREAFDAVFVYMDDEEFREVVGLRRRFRSREVVRTPPLRQRRHPRLGLLQRIGLNRWPFGAAKYMPPGDKLD